MGNTTRKYFDRSLIVNKLSLIIVHLSLHRVSYEYTTFPTTRSRRVTKTTVGTRKMATAKVTDFHVQVFPLTVCLCLSFFVLFYSAVFSRQTTSK